jgi:ABC-type bacteriocin/lantibiotic exporter with double-glycine peptidase domain
MEKTKAHIIIEKIAELISHSYNPFEFQKNILHINDYSDENDFVTLSNDLIEASNKIQLMLIQHHATKEDFIIILKKFDFPFLVFERDENDKIIPSIILKEKGATNVYKLGTDKKFEKSKFDTNLLDNYLKKSEYGNKYDSQIIFLSPASINSLISPNISREDYSDDKEYTPVRRLFRLLSTERKEIGYIYIYAVAIGLISLSLPLGIQAIINLISSGLVFKTVIFLIVGVILGVILGGVLQILQTSMVEVLQRRIFAKAAFEFAYRIPKIKAESILKEYAPELMNRFFDILTVQKGLPKLLIEISSALLQIIFGMLLLSFYHPIFIAFGVILVAILITLFYITGAKGLKTSIYESKYKYKIAHWLQELGRTLIPFKLAGFTNLPLDKMDYYLNNYLKSRKAHFGVLVNQYSFIIIFKAIITGGVLVMGALLVTEKEITLGQFVASEIIIILIINAVEKIIVSMDVIYDLLTALDKIGNVTDLPLEKEQGAVFPRTDDEVGMELQLKNLKYRYEGKTRDTIQEISLKIEKGQRVAISGNSNSGKNTLMQILSGILHNYEGVITMDGLSLRDIDVNSLRDNVGIYVSEEHVFDGTIYENISMGISRTNIYDVMNAIESVGLSDTINALPEGLNTPLIAGGKGFSTSTIKKICLARAIAEKPRLLIINDFLGQLDKSEKLKILSFLFDPKNKWSLICVTNDPAFLSFCDKIFVLDNGYLAAEDTFENLNKINWFRDRLD